MATQAEPSPEIARRPDRLRTAVVVAGIACLVGAGLLLWSRTGDAVFSDLVLAALAWCF
jgi:hypothetical protein